MTENMNSKVKLLKLPKSGVLKGNLSIGKSSQMTIYVESVVSCTFLLTNAGETSMAR